MEKNTSLQTLPGSLLSLISTTTLEVNDKYMDKPRKRDEYWAQGGHPGVRDLLRAEEAGETGNAYTVLEEIFTRSPPSQEEEDRPSRPGKEHAQRPRDMVSSENCSEFKCC